MAPGRWDVRRFTPSRSVCDSPSKTRTDRKTMFSSRRLSLLPGLLRLDFSRGIGRRIIQRLADCRHDRLETPHPREPLEIRFHHRPWRGERAGLLQHLLDRHVVAVPFFAVAPVLRRQLPALVRRILALFEASQLLFRT